MHLLERVDRIIGFGSSDQVVADFGRERVRSVRGVIHLYYLTILAPFAAAAWFHWDKDLTKFTAAALLSAAVLRFRHWTFPIASDKAEDVSPRAARITGAMVVILSLIQSVFYLSLALGLDELPDATPPWPNFAFLGLLSAIVQCAALTGIIFASRVIFTCFVAPQVMGLLYLHGIAQWPVSLAVALVAAICFYLAELGHRTQLRLFAARREADSALTRMELANLELTDARRYAQQQADTDCLTGVRTRSAFLSDVQARIEAGQSGLLAVVDLDRFKPINHIYGQEAGDHVLQCVAARLSTAMPDDAIIGRLGGDEFGIFIAGTLDAGGAGEVVRVFDNALGILREPVNMGNSTVSITASAGAQALCGGDSDLGGALRDAGTALQVAKREQLLVTQMFDQAVRLESERLHLVESELAKLDLRGELSLVYQPIINLRSGEIESLEALARWQHPDLGEVSPALFIPAAERLGQIGDITLSLLGQALEFASSSSHPFLLSFNLSAAHICCEGAARDIVRVIEEAQLPTHRLQFEITETAMLVNFTVARSNIDILRDAGCGIALDDFGAGFASLVYLREIRFDKIKIDGSLIRGARDPQGRDVLNGVLRMIEAMNLESVAEYIASEDDEKVAVELGAHFGQGHYLSQPLNDKDALTLLNQAKGAALTADGYNAARPDTCTRRPYAAGTRHLKRHPSAAAPYNQFNEASA
ncbi:putative bifunctional diguanylate cyclase/phosphodiesterase [Qipengyuania sp.]|uniref:putative bifunctional diguanylate cyclase/phosphodiesterase n=1 Tax=Qipengyuania sp. TaxID=2004515 RepID=UPI003AF41A90